jgi:DNA polymerase phi
MFSPNLVRTLLNQSKKDNRFLHTSATNAWKAITHRAQQFPTSTVPLVVALTSDHGSADMETFIKTKSLEQILLSADDDALEKIVRHLYLIIIRPESSEQAIADRRRQNIADLLLHLVRQYKHYESLIPDFLSKANWLRSTLELFVEFAYFTPSKMAKTRKIPLPLVSDSNRTMFQERLTSCLSRLLPLESESKASFGLVVVEMIRTKAATSKGFEPVFKAEDGIAESVEKAFQALKRLSSQVHLTFMIHAHSSLTHFSQTSASDQSSATRGFLLLYAFTLLQVYNGDGDAILMLEDLSNASQTIISPKKDSSTHAKDGFVEIILSHLGNPRAIFHKIATEAFATFASELTAEGLESLTQALDTEETLEGQKSLFAQEGDQEDDGDGDNDSSEDSEDDSEASDVEMIDGGSNAGDGDGDESSEESSSESGEDSDDASEADEELQQFNNMLAMTLQTSKPSMDGEGSESSDSDMDDDQMMALDEQLSKIFKQRSQITGKKQRKDAKQNMVQFKSRILDLMAVFLEKQYSNPLTLEALLPVLRLTRASASKQLSDKSAKLLKSAFDTNSKQKTPLPKPVHVEATWEILQGIHEEAKAGGGANLHATSCSAASLHMVRVLVGLDKENYARISEVYASSQTEWFMKKDSSVQPVLFSQFLNWSTQFRSMKLRQ